MSVLADGTYGTPTVYPVYPDGPRHTVNAPVRDIDLYRAKNHPQEPDWANTKKRERALRQASIKLKENMEDKAAGRQVRNSQPFYLGRGLYSFDFRHKRHHESYPDCFKCRPGK